MTQQTEHAFVTTCRRIVSERQALRYKRQAVDLFSASAVVRVWDAISPANRDKLARIADTKGPARVVAICFQLLA